jgi:large subunit ribosomal protein L33
MADGDRVKVILECTEEPGTSRYHTTKNRKNDSDRLEMMKYNPVLQKHTLHRETK